MLKKFVKTFTARIKENKKSVLSSVTNFGIKPEVKKPVKKTKNGKKRKNRGDDEEIDFDDEKSDDEDLVSGSDKDDSAVSDQE